MRKNIWSYNFKQSRLRDYRGRFISDPSPEFFIMLGVLALLPFVLGAYFFARVYRYSKWVKKEYRNIKSHKEVFLRQELCRVGRIFSITIFILSCVDLSIFHYFKFYSIIGLALSVFLTLVASYFFKKNSLLLNKENKIKQKMKKKKEETPNNEVFYYESKKAS